MTERPLNDINVLIVEDSPENREILTYFLRMAGAQVETAEDGRRGVKVASHDTFDIVLMDLEMPHIDGYTAVRMLRAMKFPGKILALSAHESQEVRRRCSEVGFDGYISKPVKRAHLIQLIEETHDSTRRQRPIEPDQMFGV